MFLMMIGVCLGAKIATSNCVTTTLQIAAVSGCWQPSLVRTAEVLSSGQSQEVAVEGIESAYSKGIIFAFFRILSVRLTGVAVAVGCAHK